MKSHSTPKALHSTAQGCVATLDTSVHVNGTPKVLHKSVAPVCNAFGVSKDSADSSTQGALASSRPWAVECNAFGVAPVCDGVLKIFPLLLAFAMIGVSVAEEASVPLAAQSSLEYDDPIELCKLKNKKISESSGLAISHRNPNVFWTHNDSGDKPRLYCFNRKGKDLGTTKVKGAGSHDWEDMCSYTFNGHAKLLVGDIGDNGSSRKYCKLYVMTEPKKPGDNVKRCQPIRLRYSTGSMDCESIAVDVERQKLLLIEKKRWVKCRVFAADFPLDPETGELKTDKLKRDKKDNVVLLTAEPIAQIDVPIVCAMDVSSDGRRAIALTLGEAFEFERGEKESWKAAFARKPRKIHMPARRQGESICYDAEGRDLFLTSELTPTPLFRVPVKE